MYYLRMPAAFVIGAALSLLAATPLLAQERHAFSVEQSVTYALQNNEDVRNAILSRKSAWSQKNETRAQGLPQLSANGSVVYNYKIPRSAVPAQLFDPSATAGEFVGVEFSPKATSSGQIEFSQLVFDGRYITALRASKAFLRLAEVQANRTEVEVAENVTKAYYNSLVSRYQLNLLLTNLQRSEQQLRETQLQVDNGLAESIDVNRLRVSLNSLQTDIENAQAAVDVSLLLLKFQMGMPLQDELVQTDSIGVDANTLAQATEKLVQLDGFRPENRIEFQELLRNREFNEFNVTQYQAGFLPDLRLNANYGYNTFGQDLRTMYGSNVFGQGSVSVALNIPIFDGFLKRSQIEQARYSNQRLDNSINQARQNYQLQFDQARVNMRNALRRVELQQQNVTLANDVYSQTQLKYSQGIGSNLEVTIAEGELREAQINAANAVLDAYLAQVDLQVATGTLLKK